MGIPFHRFSLRRYEGELVDEKDRAERERTRSVLNAGVFGFLGALFRVALQRPRAFARALRLAVKVGRIDERGLWRTLIYFAESCVLLEWTADLGIDHIHAHYGDCSIATGADSKIARQEQGESTWDPLNASELAPNSANGLIPSLIAWAKSQLPGNVAIVSHYGTNSATVAMLCRVFGGPTYSFTMHGPEEFDAPRANCLCEKIRRARFVVAISEFARSQLYRWADYHDWAKIHVIHCGVGPRAIDRLILGKLGNRLCRAGRSISPGNTSWSSRMETFTEGSLLAFLATVPDPRSRHGRRHPLSASLLGKIIRGSAGMNVCCAIMCGARVTRLSVNGLRTRTSR